ncbi:MAG: protein kinase [Gemmatimonadota bacterium]|nr:MAG: protein kinase [Gemmatimonadota bacterium]
MNSMIGQNISHYKILEKLGEGGMGVVYKAEDTKLKRTVALKFLPPQMTRDPEAKERFMLEAQAASALEHNNICNIHHIDETEEGQTFMVMACYEGESLREKIERGPLKTEETIRIASQIAYGLKKAHEKAIVHRDIKSANIFVTTDGVAKILDFGLAKLRGQTKVTKEGTTLGTAAYMSPEQARGEEVDYRTDIWSLGVVLYEMITGQLPFKGDYEQAVVYLVLNEEPEPLSKLRPDVPSKLEHIVGKTLAKSQNERYDNVEALLEDLKALKKLLKSNLPLEKASDEASKPSIAVLPFRDMSSQKDQEYFCEGIAEELINALVKLDGLRVAARTSAFQFKDRDSDIKKIGSRLDVQTVLEGSVRKAGDRLRITAQLINVNDGFHLWSEKYDRKLEDIFAIQDEISLAIVDKLKVKLLRQEKTALVRRHTVDQEAYNLYLKGLYFWNRRLEGGMRKAMEFFQQAIEKDPDYALAHVGIADVYNITGFFGFLSPAETFPKAKAAAEKALAIDNKLGEAHASLAWATTYYDWNWSSAEKLYVRAIELNPQYGTAHEWYAIYLWAMGRFDEAIAEAETARELDPLSLIINTIVGIAYYFARRYDESIANHKKALEMDPNFLLANTYIVMPYVDKGMYNEAVDIMRKAEPSAAEHAYSLGYFGGAYGRAGLKDDALRILARLDELARRRYVSTFNRAVVLAGMGEFDEALDDMEKSIEDRCPTNIFSKTFPYFDCLQSNKRFQSLLKKIGLDK